MDFLQSILHCTGSIDFNGAPFIHLFIDTNVSVAVDTCHLCYFTAGLLYFGSSRHAAPAHLISACAGFPWRLDCTCTGLTSDGFTSARMTECEICCRSFVSRSKLQRHFRSRRHAILEYNLYLTKRKGQISVKVRYQ